MLLTWTNKTDVKYYLIIILNCISLTLRIFSLLYQPFRFFLGKRPESFGYLPVVCLFLVNIQEFFLCSLMFRSYVSVLHPILLPKILHCMKYFIHTFCISIHQLIDIFLLSIYYESCCYEHACVTSCVDIGVHFSWLYLSHTP